MSDQPKDGVSLVERDLSDVMTGLQAVQRLQAAYDEVGWRVQDPSWAKARHILYHLVSATAKVSSLIEGVEHAVERGVTPSSEEFSTTLGEHSRLAAELVFHGAQLANIAGDDLGTLLQTLWRENAQRFAPDSVFAALP